MTRPSIHVRIERLVLTSGDGLDLERRDGGAIQAAVEAELGRLLGEGGLRPDLASGGAVPSVRGGALETPSRADAGAGPSALGTGIARAVYGGIGR